jgi:hypothetical protein
MSYAALKALLKELKAIVSFTINSHQFLLLPNNRREFYLPGKNCPEDKVDNQEVVAYDGRVVDDALVLESVPARGWLDNWRS